MVNSTGARAAPAQPVIRASTVRPSARARSALISTSAAAPSLIDEALAAVTGPSFLKTGLRVAISPDARSSDLVLAHQHPFTLLAGTWTGTISAANCPSCWAC